MSTHIISRRIQSIIQFVYDANYPSKSDILDFLKAKDFELSTRTLERDIDIIRADIGLDIVFSKTNKGYYIDEDESVKVESFFKFLEIVTVASIFNESLKDNKKILEHVSFDDSKYFHGINNLKDILLALTQKRKLHFTHENFIRKTFKSYIITPFLLKEYENRWYVVGVPESMNEIRTFGIDRITELKIGSLSKVSRRKHEDQINKFDNIIGLDFDNNEPVDVRLLVDELHLNYMRSLPLHHSQVIHSVNEQGQGFVDFCLVPNYEFITQILKIGSEVEVIYPKELRVRIKNELQKTLNRYT